MGVEDGTVYVLDWTSGQQRHVLRSHDPTPLGAQVPAVAYSPDGNLIATGGYHGAVKLWRPGDGALLGALPCHTGSIHAMTWVGERRLAVAGGHGGQVWSVAI